MSDPAATFLSPQEIAELTDVRIGKFGKTREELQIAAIKAMRIPFHVSAIGRPKVSRAVINGGAERAAPAPAWEPSPSWGKA